MRKKLETGNVLEYFPPSLQGLQSPLGIKRSSIFRKRSITSELLLLTKSSRSNRQIRQSGNRSEKVEICDRVVNQLGIK